MRLLVVALVIAGCTGKVPDTRYYQLAPPAKAGRAGELVLALEPLVTEPAYDDERIVYRTTPYRLDYYQYHRWSASPGVMVGNFLETALETSGAFRAVVRQPADAPIVLGGRVLAIEEVDTSAEHWVGRIVVELVVSDAKTGAPLWTEQYEETEPLDRQSPEGLARALSVALGRIAAKATPAIAEIARTRVATARNP